MFNNFVFYKSMWKKREKLILHFEIIKVKRKGQKNGFQNYIIVFKFICFIETEEHLSDIINRWKEMFIMIKGKLWWLADDWQENLLSSISTSFSVWSVGEGGKNSGDYSCLTTSISVNWREECFVGVISTSGATRPTHLILKAVLPPGIWHIAPDFHLNENVI